MLRWLRSFALNARCALNMPVAVNGQALTREHYTTTPYEYKSNPVRPSGLALCCRHASRGVV